MANPEDKEHNKAILKLVGDRIAPKPANLTIRRQTIQESKVVMKIGRAGRVKPTPDTGAKMVSPPSPAEVEESRPSCPAPTEEEIFPPLPQGWTTVESMTPDDPHDPNVIFERR